MDRSELERAALDAELHTGDVEATEAEARSHVLVRLGRMAFGSSLVLVGIVLLPLPGPGWLIIAGGLMVLARDAVWADRLLRTVRRRVPGVPEDGPVPRQALVVGVLVGAAAAAASLWFALGG